MKTVSLLSTDFTFFLFVYSAILLALYYFVIKKYSPMVTLSVILFLLTSYNQSLFVIRQHLAVALCIATIPLIINRKLVYYLIICAIAFFLHHSAIVFVPLFFLYKFDGKKLIWVILIVALSMNIFFSTILKSFATELGYWGYIETERYEGLNYINFLISLSFLLLYVFSLKKLIFKLGINKIVFIALAISTMFNLFGVGYAIGRLGIYFSVFTIIALPLSLGQVKNSLVKFGIIVMALALLFYPMYLGSASRFWEEYRFVWQSI